MKLTFKEYLETKEQLRVALAETPKQSITYCVSKYCKLMVGESKEHKEHIKLKPKQTITIEWFYEDIDSPTVLNVIFEGVSPTVDSNAYKLYWSSTKIQNWLTRNSFIK